MTTLWLPTCIFVPGANVPAGAVVAGRETGALYTPALGDAPAKDGLNAGADMVVGRTVSGMSTLSDKTISVMNTQSAKINNDEKKKRLDCGVDSLLLAYGWLYVCMVGEGSRERMVRSI
jgi:hypothetical protein